MDSTSHGRLTKARSFANEELARFPETEIATEFLRRLELPPGADNRVALDELQILGERIRDRLEDRFDLETNRWSIRAAALLVHFVRDCVQKHGLPIEGAVHVDLGCGSQNPYGRMFVHLMLGAKQAYCMDLDPPQDPAKAVRQLARLVTGAVLRPSTLFPHVVVDRVRILQNLADFDLERIAKGDAGGIPRRLQYLQRSILATGLDAGSVDCVFTNSVLEHMPDLDAMFAECARITRRGGYNVHGVDFRDHRHYGDAKVHTLQFLCEHAGDAMVSGCNRMRRHQVVAACERNGFEVVEAASWDAFEVTPQFRAGLVSPFREMSDEQLSHRWVSFLLRRR